MKRYNSINWNWIFLGILLPIISFFVSMTGVFAFFTATASKTEAKTKTAIISIGYTNNTNGFLNSTAITGDSIINPGDTLKISGAVQNTGDDDVYTILHFELYTKKSGQNEIQIVDKYYTFPTSSSSSTLIEIPQLTDPNAEYTASAKKLTANTSTMLGETANFELDYTFDWFDYDNSYQNATACYLLTAQAIQVANLTDGVQATNLLMGIKNPKISLTISNLESGNTTSYFINTGTSIADILASCETVYNSTNSCGWFTDKACTIPVDTSAPATHGLTLYTNKATTDCLTISNGSVTSVDTTKLPSDGMVVIPKEYNGVQVSSIADTVFYQKTSIKSVVLPSGITTIGANTFRESSLESINLPEGLTTIKDMAFSKCASLKDVTLPSSLTSLGQYAFLYCSSLTKITIPGSIKTVSFGAIGACSNLQTVILEEGVESLAQQAIAQNSNLTSVTLPSTLKSIGRSAFTACTSLENITLPSNLQTLGQQAFASCSKLQSINIPGSVNTVGVGAFWKCTNLKSATLNEGIEIIGLQAFNECNTLEEISLPSTLKQIRRAAFNDCYKLKRLDLNEGLIFIASFAFNHCNSIENTTITIPSTLVQIGGDEYTGDNEDNSIIGSHVFYDFGDNYVSSFRVATGNKHFVSKDGVLYTKNLKYMVAYPAAKTSESYSIEEGCEYIYELGLGRPSYLKSLHLPDSYIIDSPSNLPSTFQNTQNSFICSIYVFNKIETYTVNSTNTKYTSINGQLYTKDGKTLLAVPTKCWDNNKVIKLADSCTTISAGALYWSDDGAEYTYVGGTVGGYPSMIVIGENVTTIEESAFVRLYKGTKVLCEATQKPSGWATTLGNDSSIYYYSESTPTTTGNYWHYVHGIPTVY